MKSFARKIFRPKEYCVFIPLPGESFVLDPKSRTYYYGNETTVPIFQALLTAYQQANGAGLPFETLKKILPALFEVTEKQAAAELQKFLGAMLKLELIEETDKAAELPAPPTYPWERGEYAAPTLEETPLDLPDPGRVALMVYLAPTVRPRSFGA